MKLACVPPHLVEDVWPHVSHWIKAAMERVDVTPFAQVEAEALSGENLVLVWLATDGQRIGAVALTDIRMDERKVCILIACGGERMKDWVHLIAGLEDYAKAEGCTAMRIIGPRAWARVLDGYHEQAVVLERQL